MLMPQWQTKTPVRGPIPRQVALHRELLRRGQGAPAGGQKPLRAGGGAARLHDRLGDVLGAGEGAADEHPFPGGLDRVLPERLAEAVLLEVDAEVLRKLAPLPSGA